MAENERILIIGNSGSGKTWLGNALSQSKKIPLFHMDAIRWDKGAYEIRRSSSDIAKDLDAINKERSVDSGGRFWKNGTRVPSFFDLADLVGFTMGRMQKKPPFSRPQV